MDRIIDVLKIVKEDVLRILAERSEKVSLEFIKAEIKVASSIVSKVIEILQGENLISTENGFIMLTTNGLVQAAEIVEKHLVIEEYFKARRNKKEAHEIANLLEHSISKEVLENIKKLSTLKKRGISLINFGLNKNGLITSIPSSDYKLFERMISFGILPGHLIKVTHEVPDGVIVKMGNQEIILDRVIAKGIKVLEHEIS
ncbi:MAG: FeoA domain-containing protein [Deltaproteobacteria bacterium]|nr:FeoA domain-containing protein [Deltaproteobacteria bacterium]